MPYTLLRQEILETEFPAAVARGMSFVIGAPYQSGILASGSKGASNADYAAPSPELIKQVEGIEAVCARHGVPLRIAAANFPLGHPAITALLIGGETPDQFSETVAALRTPIPAALWADLRAEGLIRADAPVPA